MQRRYYQKFLEIHGDLNLSVSEAQTTECLPRAELLTRGGLRRRRRELRVCPTFRSNEGWSPNALGARRILASDRAAHSAGPIGPILPGFTSISDHRS